MPALRTFVLTCALVCAGGCGGKQSLDETGITMVRLPDGQEIRAELVTHPKDMMRGMMFRESLAADRGMLFIHGQPGKYPYWMYQVKIPLDIIWMSRGRQVVEISPNTPPCQSTSSSQCPSYGGTQEAVYVLELPAGAAARHNIDVGDTLVF